MIKKLIKLIFVKFLFWIREKKLGNQCNSEEAHFFKHEILTFSPYENNQCMIKMGRKRILLYLRKIPTEFSQSIQNFLRYVFGWWENAKTFSLTHSIPIPLRFLITTCLSRAELFCQTGISESTSFVLFGKLFEFSTSFNILIN